MTELLTIAERTKLPAVLARRSRFANMVVLLLRTIQTFLAIAFFFLVEQALERQQS